MQIGVLSVQGNFAEHRKMLEELGVSVTEVRRSKDLEGVSALVLPGGESTVIMKFLDESGLGKDIADRVRSGMPVLATCAGTILLSDSHMKLMDISVDRNAYGSQIQSFEASIDVEGKKMHVSFIRAPKITRIGASVSVLAMHDGLPVIVRQGNMLAATCHPEMCGETGLHQLFLSFLDE